MSNKGKESIITEQDVVSAQMAWADSIVDIGNVFKNNGDYREAAAEYIKKLYAYDLGEVLFKPTFASNQQFRTTFEDALSYFVGGSIDEDNGFAIKPWGKVRFGEQKIIIDTETAIAMGNYYFTKADNEKENKVEYTFGYVKDGDEYLRINLHHSSLPYIAE